MWGVQRPGAIDDWCSATRMATVIAMETNWMPSVCVEVLRGRRGADSL